MADKQISDLTSASALTDGSLFVLEQGGAAMKANWGMMKNYISPGVAAQYSSSSTYAVGDYVIYNGSLYRCTTAITTAETWTAAHWTAAVLADDVGDVKSALKNVFSLSSNDAESIPENSDLNNYTTVGNYKVTSGATAETIANMPYQTSGRLAVMQSSYTGVIMQFYIANSSISLMIYYRMQASGTWGNWVRFASEIDIAELASENETLHNNTAILANGEFDKGALIDDIYLRPSNGTEASYAGYKATDFITLYGITKLYAYIVSGSDGYAENAFYDVNKAFISSFRTPNGESEHIVPSNAAYVRFSNTDEAMNSLRIYTVGGLAYANSAVYRSQAGIIAQNITLASIPAGNNSAVTLLTGVSLQPGTYYLSCEQQTSLVSTTRNVLFYRKSGQDRVFDNTAVDVIFAGHRVWRFTILEAGTYDFGVWVVDNSDILLIDNVVLASMPEPETIPNYYTVQLNNVASNFNMLTASGDGDSFVFITDIHYPNNRMFSPLLAKWVCDATNTRRIIINGDYINKENTKSDALNMICRTAALYNFPGIDTFRTVGNHEYNNPSASDASEDLAKELSTSELKNAITNTNVPSIVFDNNTLSYYFDNARKKIRYLVGIVDRASNIPVASVKFIADHINDAPDGYICVIINHTVLTYTNNQPTPVPSAAPLVTLIDAVRNHGSVTVQGTSYNFSGRNVDVAGVLCGDYHLDMIYRTSGGVPIIATTCDTLQEATGGLTRTLGTISESAFDIVYINTINRIINLRRIGAGSDRNVTFDA